MAADDCGSVTSIPTHTGIGLAAVILGTACLPLTAYLGCKSLAVSLPVFGLWFFLPVIAIAIGMGAFASRSAQGVAGAALGVAALVMCLTFVVVDRSYGPRIRGQLRGDGASPASQVDIEQLLKLGASATQPSR
jgi:hypothetical protein